MNIPGHAKILLLTVCPGVPNVPVEDIKRTTLHEIGHSLGLFGHSPIADDTMYCSVSDRQKGLTDRDTKTLLHLYKPNVHLAQQYHELGLPGNSIALNEDGAQLLAAREYQKADEKFIAALKLNPDCPAAKRNFASSLTAQAQDNAAKGDLEGTVARLKLALDLQNSESDKQEQSTILHNLADAYNKMKLAPEAEQCLAAADKLLKEDTDSPDATPPVAGSDASSTANPPQSNDQYHKPPNIAHSASTQPSHSGAYLLFSQPPSSSKAFQLGVEQTVRSNEVDFGPFMADLQKRIKRAWFPPKGNESKRVVVVFKVHQGGALSNIKLANGSGLAIADGAALQAVQNAAPFRPLPAGAPKDVDVQFTFDYKVFIGDGHGTFRKF